jgi:hypothetical protein
MKNVIDSDLDSLHVNIARRLLDLVQSDPRTMPETSPRWWLRIVDRFEQWLTARRLIWLLSVGMLLLGLITLKNPFQVWLEHTMPNSTLVVFLQIHSGRQIAIIDEPSLFNIRLGLEVGVGLALLISTILILVKKQHLALDLGYLSLLVSLAVLDMLLFYFEQFSTVFIVAYQFVILSGVMYYRRKYLKTND